MRRLAISADAVFAVAISLLATAVSQQSPQSSPAPEPSFKATTRVVNVNVVVTDTHGNPITGLTKDDFELLDDGKPQSIRFFEAVDNASSPPAAPLPPNTYTNQLMAKGAPPNFTALLIDVQDSDWISQNYSLHRVQAFLRKLRHDERFAIYLLTDDKFTTLHDFTKDSSDLIAAIQHYDAQHSGPKDQRPKPDASSVSELDRFLAGGDIEFRFSQWRGATGINRVPGQGAFGGPHFPTIGDPSAYHRRTPGVNLVATLGGIARQLATAPGRKSLVWLYSDSLDLLPDDNRLKKQLIARLARSYGPAQPDGSRDANARAKRDFLAGLYSGDMVPLLVRLFNDNGIAVYPVDAQGLQAVGDSYDPLGFKNPDGPGLGSFWITPSTYVQQQMMSLAAKTGGRGHYNRNDLETGIQHALDDGRYSYEIAYYPDHNDWHGEWRKIKIELTDPKKYVKPPSGAQEIKNFFVGGFSPHVLARGGYYALPAAKLPGHADERSLEIARSPLEVPEIPITVRMSPPSGTDASAVEAKVILNAQKLFTNQPGPEWKSNFEVKFFQLAAKNAVLGVTTQNVNVELDQEKYSEALTKGINTLERLQLKPGATLLCVIVHDKSTDAVGSVRIPLDQYAATPHQTETPH